MSVVVNSITDIFESITHDIRRIQMAFGKKNEIKIDPLKYNIALLGESGIGKTTIIKEFCEKVGGEDSYLFLEMNGEAGADAINGIIYEDVDDWDMVEDIVTDIEDNKTKEYPNLRAVVIDTYDGWISLAQNEAIRLWNKEHPDKKADSIDASWNGFQKGQGKAFDLMFDIIKRLRNVGVATIIIGHVKNREITDVASGVTYQQLTSDVEKVYFNLLKKKMHFVGLAYFDRTIITEKTGKKNLVTKKEETVNRVTEETRKIKFRDPETLAVDSKSRFANIVTEINFDVDELISAMTNAIKDEANKGSKPIEELEKEQKKAEEARVKQIAKAEEENKTKKELNKVVTQIVDFIKENKSDVATIKPVVAKVKELCGSTNPADLTSIDDALIVLGLIEE